MRCIASWVLGLVVAAPALAADKDIVETAASAGSYDTLVRALRSADLVDTLKGPGPFTVFAPTDEAFAKLPSGTMDDLLKPENKQRLTEILNYHIVPGKVLSASLLGLGEQPITSVQGSTLPVTTSGASLRVADARVLQTDIDATNGVIHAIDTVLMPPDAPGDTSVVPTAVDRPDTIPAPLATPGTPALDPVAGSTTTPLQPDASDRPAPLTTPLTPTPAPVAGYTTTMPTSPYPVYRPQPPTPPYYSNMPTVQRRRGLGGLLRRLNPFATRYR
jgi:uncharacterized surface protein with fasciclin (FAS1) repeats